MRVVGGSARGRRLEAPAGDRTRPTTDRVREATFNALWSRGAIDDAEVLDLFAGSGALGIEALSRGAAHATFVDDDPRARRVVERNLAACGFTDRAEVVADRAGRFLARLRATAAEPPNPAPAPTPSAAGDVDALGSGSGSGSESGRPSGPTPAHGAGAASASGRRFDVAFCDPPYAFAGWEELLADLPADLVVIEAAAEVDLPDGWELVREARYGGTWVGFAERR